MRIPVFLWLIFLSSLIICACQKPKRTLVNHGFYFWKTNYKVSENENKLLDSLGVHQLYIRAFDVAWNEVQGAIPVAPIYIDWYERRNIHRDCIPTIYIKNLVFEKISKEGLKDLAFKIKSRIQNCFGDSIFSEIQLDCDWTANTREKYFEFIQEFKKAEHPAKISVTIRLHQFRYPKSAGVPPADKGMLMVYNMDNLRNPTTKNSILDPKVADKYLSGFGTYPIRLDVALPLFSWGVMFRDNQFKGLINNLSHYELKKYSFFKELSPSQFQCTADTVFRDFYYRQGDIIRLETVSNSDLIEVAEKVNEKVDNDSLTVVFFHLDPALLNNETYEICRKVYHIFN